MGAYINPPNETKEWWLERVGECVSIKTRWDDIPDNKLPVILMFNEMFTAAGVGVDKDEYGELAGFDGRCKKIYLVDKDIVEQAIYHNKY